MADDPLYPDDPSPAEDPARADGDDERRLLRFVADRGGPAATTNVTGRGGEIGIDGEVIPNLLEALEGRGLVETLDDGDVRLTASGRSYVEMLGD
jgi:hypothetical protein